MKSEQLQQFLEVARQEHLGRAAARLRLTPSALSHGIRQLEIDLGHALFEKRGRRIFLTPHGRTLVTHAEAILGRIEEARTTLRRPELPWKGRLVLGAGHGLLVGRVAASLADHAGDEIEFTLYSMRSADVLGAVLKGELDWGLALSSNPHPQLRRSVLARLPLSVVVRKKHPLAGNADPKRLGSLPFAAPRAFSGLEVCERHPELARRGIEADPVFLYDAYDVAARWLGASEGWTLLPLDLIEGSPRKELVAMPIRGWKASVEIHAVSLNERPLPPPLTALEKRISGIWP